MSDNPSVSVIIPARNAPDVLPKALKSIEHQTYENIVEVIVAAADVETANAAGSAIVVDNSDGSTPAGLNLALARAHGDVIVRCDAQSVLPPGYVAEAVATLQRTGAVNVGGMQIPNGESKWEKAIASAMTSRFGAGDARYRIGGPEGPVETVYLGVFRRDALDAVGGFDERFFRTQDYELNHRLVEAGGIVWFNPALKVAYTPRGSLSTLSAQYWAYGAAKRSFARKHPKSLRLRQLAPPLLVAVLTISLFTSLFLPAVLLVPFLYALVVLAVSSPSWRKAAALVTMHISWGLGFLTGYER